MSLQVLRCLSISLLILSLKGFGNALSVDEKTVHKNPAGKQNIFSNIKYVPAEQTPDPLQSVTAVQNLAFQGEFRFPFKKLTRTSVMDRLTNKLTSQKNRKRLYPESHVSPARYLVSWLGTKIQTILRHLIQPMVKKYFALTETHPIQSGLPLKHETDNSQFKSDKSSGNFAENTFSTIGEKLKIKISDLVDSKYKLNSRRIATAFDLRDGTAKQRNRRSPNKFLAKDIYLPRQSSELGSDKPNKHLWKSLKSHSILADSGEHHVDDLFLDENFMKDVSYFVNHPDRMSAPDAPGIVGIGKFRPTKPTPTSTTARTIIKAVGNNKASVSERSKYKAGSSHDEETETIHEYTKTVESHKSTVRTRKKSKNHEQAENSINVSVGSQYLETFPYNKHSKMESQGVAQRSPLLTSLLQTAGVASTVQENKVDYSNEAVFSTLAYSQSHISTTPRTVNQLSSKRSWHNTTPEEYTISSNEKPLNSQQSTSNPMGIVPEDPHRTSNGYNQEHLSSHNVIDENNVFYGNGPSDTPYLSLQPQLESSNINGPSDAPYLSLQPQLESLNINTISEGEMSSGKSKELVPENTYRFQLPYSNDPITNAQETVPEAYDINTYGPNNERFWNPQSFYRGFNSLYSYGNWKNGRFPDVSAF